MFWFNRSIKEIATYTHQLKPSEKETIQKLFISTYKSELATKDRQDIKLSFNARDKQLVKNNEIAYLKALYSGSEDQANILAKINECLSHDNLLFDVSNNVIINNSGACAQIKLIQEQGQPMILKTRRQEDRQGRIANEYEILRSLNKNNDDKQYIIQVYKFVGTDSYLMEVADFTLEYFVLNVMEKQHSIESKFAIILQILKSVDYIHGLGYLHRDLHPGNIFYVQGCWKIGDFGFATNIASLNNEEIKTGYGRLDYVAPEQLDNLNNVTVASDIYSIGKIINFILTKNPKNNNHLLLEMTKKCFNIDLSKRYHMVIELEQEIRLFMRQNGLHVNSL